MDSIKRWLASLGLGQYAEEFERNDIDLSLLSRLTDQYLRDLGVQSLGHRMKLLEAIAVLKSGDALSSSHAAAVIQTYSPGTPAAEGERRQLTVMFCDLVSSTAMSERLDPEELRAIIRAYQQAAAQVIERFGGHIAQYLGDGLLVYFGHPLTHEDDVQRAVAAGLGIVATMAELNARMLQGAQARLSVRIGIHTGLVVVGEVGGGERREQLALGDTPNLAARLQALAEPDTVVVSERTHRLAGGGFEYADQGEQSLKGIAMPVRVWLVKGTSQAASRFDAATQGVLTPLVGREHEIAMCLERWELAQDSEGQVVLLSGEPGIGKSRILSALWERLGSQAATALRFQCSSYHANSALYPIIDNFERALNFARGDSLDAKLDKLDKLEALVVSHYGRPQSDARFIAAMLSIPCDERYGPLAMTPQKQKEETLRSLLDVTDAAARKQPTVMLFEDAHWADPTTLELLDLLIARVSSIPLLIVLTHRPEFQPKWGGHGHVTALNLSKLTRAQSRGIMSKLVGGKTLPAGLLEKVLAKTDGVPLFVEELTKAVLESGQLKDAGDHYEYAGGSQSIAIPSTLRDSLMARLDRSAQVKEIAQTGAAIGREFSYGLIADVASKPKAELDRALEQLTESGLAFRRGIPPEATYTFKHALVQDAAYDSLLKTRRQGLHAKIARALEEHFPATQDTEPELIAHHLTAAGETELAIGYWQKAGELALKRLALNEAISHLNKGMELMGNLPESAKRDAIELDLRTPLGTAWLALKGWAAPEVWTSFRPALGLAKSLNRQEALVPIYYGLYTNVLAQGRIAETLAWVEEMLATAEASGDTDLLISGHRAACTSHFWLGNFNRSREHADQVMDLYSEEKHRPLADIMNTDPKTVVGIYVSLATWMLGFPDRAVQVGDAKDAHARRRGHPFDLGWALTAGSQIWAFRGEPEPLVVRAEEAERLGRAHSLPFVSEVLAQLMKGVAWLREGRLAEGNPHLRAAIETWSAGGALIWTPYLGAVLAEGLALSGDLGGASSLIEKSLGQIGRPGWEERWPLAEVLRLKGSILSLQGDLDGAERSYLASLGCAREQLAKSWELRTSVSLAGLWRSQGKRKEARGLLEPVYGWFTEGFGTKDLKEARALLDEL